MQFFFEPDRFLGEPGGFNSAVALAGGRKN